MEREDIQKAYDIVFNNDEYKDIDLFGIIADGQSTEHYDLFLKEEEVYIIDWKKNRLINWYKLGHIGRCLRIIGSDMTVEEAVNMFKDIVKEWKECDYR